MHLGKKRESWIDCAKGIGIVLVVLGHTYGIPEWLHSWIYSFHMPLFFILSGYVISDLSECSVKQQVKKYAKAYLIPYFVYVGINLLLECIWLLYIKDFGGKRVLKYILGSIYCYANMEWMPNCSPLWFLVSIFLSKTWFLLTIRKVPQKWQLLSILIGACISYGISFSSLPRLPWNIAPSLMGTLLIWIGWKIKKTNVLEKILSFKKAWLSIPIIILITPVCVLNGKYVGMNENFYGNLLLFLLCGTTMAMATMLLAKKLADCRFLTDFLGRNTVVIIAFNYFARLLSTELYYMVPVIRNVKLVWPVSFIITMVTLCLIIWAHNKMEILYKTKTRGSINEETKCY